LPSRFQFSGHLVKRRAADATLASLAQYGTADVSGEVRAGNIALSVQVMLDSMDRHDSQPGLMSWAWLTGK